MRKTAASPGRRWPWPRSAPCSRPQTHGRIRHRAAALPMQFGQRVQLGPMMGERVIREVMISQGGGGLAVVYDTPPGPAGDASACCASRTSTACWR